MVDKSTPAEAVVSLNRILSQPEEQQADIIYKSEQYKYVSGSTKLED